MDSKDIGTVDVKSRYQVLAELRPLGFSAANDDDFQPKALHAFEYIPSEPYRLGQIEGAHRDFYAPGPQQVVKSRAVAVRLSFGQHSEDMILAADQCRRAEKQGYWHDFRIPAASVNRT